MRFGKVELLSPFGASILYTLFTNIGFMTCEDFLDNLVLALVKLSEAFLSCGVFKNLLCAIFARFPSGRESKRTLRFRKTVPMGFWFELIFVF